MKSQAGIGIAEVLASVALIGVGSFIMINGVDFLDRNRSKMDKSVAFENTLSSLVESIRSNIASEKITFNSNDFLKHTTYESVRESLPLCWTNDGMFPKEIAPTCPGKLGYAIYPYKSGSMELRGVYKITIRATHETFFPGEFKQYEFIVREP